MATTLRTRRWWIAGAAALTVAVTGGIAYATIPDAGGVAHTCYTKSSGAWRVIDTSLGQTCKANELPLDVYSKGGADALFLDQAEANALYLGKTEKAADSDKLDGQDSSAFLSATGTAADSDELGGREPFRYVNGLRAGIATDFVDVGDNQFVFIGFEPEGFYPGMFFRLDCDTDGTTRVVAESDVPFSWWWDGTFGEASLVGSQYEAAFAIGNGSEAHSFWSAFTNFFGPVTTLELNSRVSSGSCLFGSTLLKSANGTPGP